MKLFSLRSDVRWLVLFIPPEIALLSLAFFGYVFCRSDLKLLFYPWHEFVRRALASGQLPLWDPTIMCGVPFLASNPPAAFFYPLRFILYPFNYTVALTLYLYIHLFIAAASMFYFLKSYRLRTSACFFGGIAFMCAPYLVGRIPYLAEFTMLSVAPLALLCTKKVCETKAPRAIAVGAAVYACMHFIGQPQLLYPLTILMAFYFLDFFFRDIRRGITLWRTPLLAFSGMLVLGTLMASIVLIPFIEFVMQSDRSGGLSYSQFAKRSLPLFELFGFLVPDPFGANSIDLLQPNWEGIQRCLTPYLGVIPLILAVYSGKLFRPKYFAPVLFFLLWAIGGNWEWFEKFYIYFPGIKFTRIPERTVLVVCLILTVYSAFGFERFLDMLTSKRLRLAAFTVLVAVLIFISLGSIVFLLWKEDFALVISKIIGVRLHATFLKTTIPNIGQTALFLSLFALAVGLAARGKLSEKGFAFVLILLTVINLFLISFVTQFITEEQYFYSVRDIWDSDLSKIKDGLSPNSRIFLPLKKMNGIGFQMEAELLPNAGQIHDGILNASGYNCQLTDRYNLMEESIDKPDSLRARLLSVMSVKYLFVARGERAFKDWPPEYLPTGPSKYSFQVLRNPAFVPRFHFVRDYTVVASKEDTLAALRSDGFDPAEKAILEKAVPDFMPVSESPSASISELESRLNRISAKVTAADECLLILSDIYYPGWKASINGMPTDIFRANLLFRAVKIPKGISEVSFTYRPLSFFAGIGISGLAIFVGFALFLVGRSTGKRI